MGSLLTARNLPGIGDASPPDDEDLPECSTCDGEDPDCSYCHGRGFPEPDGEPDFDPPEDEDPPECGECNGMGRVWDVTNYGYLDCDTCNGTGYQPEPEFEPGIEVDE